MTALPVPDSGVIEKATVWELVEKLNTRNLKKIKTELSAMLN